MDGTFAALTLLLGVWDMSTNACDAGCRALRVVPGYTAISAGAAFVNEGRVGHEIFLRRDTRRAFGPFRMSFGISVTDQGAAWAGVGPLYAVPLGSERVFVQLHAMAGLYLRGDGPDLGGPIEFRSGIEVGYVAGGAGRLGGTRIGLSYDHRSNAGIYGDNPGLETIQVRVAVPF